ncbi:hypothetical protein BT67DRAFT_53781 [Trichocladium antarcticum]|uniref:Uncharacterized protein n=1 Tax=Trichocladium antarcticum TaxID=1450529 RepID=A0AAN6UIK0_9PEZI|nr:hypothetical protein BT67DRAFT_53781 [Trichocladium antarcticum]
MKNRIIASSRMHGESQRPGAMIGRQNRRQRRSLPHHGDSPRDGTVDLPDSNSKLVPASRPAAIPPLLSARERGQTPIEKKKLLAAASRGRTAGCHGIDGHACTLHRARLAAVVWRDNLAERMSVLAGVNQLRVTRSTKRSRIEVRDAKFNSRLAVITGLLATRDANAAEA